MSSDTTVTITSVAPEDVDPELRERMTQFERDTEWLDAHREELIERFPDEFVAVYAEDVVGHAQDIDSLLEQLTNKGIDPGRAARQFCFTEPPTLVL